MSDAAIAQAREVKPPAILPETHFAAARLFEAQGFIGKAITQYRKAVAVNHHYVEAYHRLGLLLSLVGRRDDAVAAFRRAVDLKPDDAILRNNLGFELLLAGQWQQAERELRRAVKLKPGFARAYVNLGIVQSKRGNFDDALASFKTVLPEADAYYNLGLMHRGHARYERAADAFRHVLSIDPQFTAARTQLASLASNVESRPDKALEPTATGDVETVALPSTPETPQTTWDEVVALLDEIMNGDVCPEPPADASDLDTTVPFDAGEPAAETEGLTRVVEADLTVPASSPDPFGPVEADVIPETATEAGPCEDVLLVDAAAATELSDEADVRDAGSRADVEEIINAIDPFLVSEAPADETSEQTLSAPARAGQPETAMLGDLETDGRASEPVELMSYADLDAEARGDPASVMCLIPDVAPTARIAAVASSTDSWALLAELEEQLSLVRNEIACLESTGLRRREITARAEPAALSGTMQLPVLAGGDSGELMGPPAEPATVASTTRTPEQRGGRKHPPEARLVVDMIEKPGVTSRAGAARAATPDSMPPASRVTPGGSPAGASTTNTEHKQNRHDKSASPARRSMSWRQKFDKVEGLLAITLNEIACTQAGERRDVDTPQPVAPGEVSSRAATWQYGPLYPDAGLLSQLFGTLGEDGTNLATTDARTWVDAPAPAGGTGADGLRGAYGHYLPPLPD